MGEPIDNLFESVEKRLFPKTPVAELAKELDSKSRDIFLKATHATDNEHQLLKLRRQVVDFCKRAIGEKNEQLSRRIKNVDEKSFGDKLKKALTKVQTKRKNAEGVKRMSKN